MTGTSFHRIIIDGRVIKNNAIQVSSKQDVNFSMNGQIVGGVGVMPTHNTTS